MWIFLSFAIEAKSAMRMYPHPWWEGLIAQDLPEQHSYKISIMNVSNYKGCARTQFSISLQVFFNTNSTRVF